MVIPFVGFLLMFLLLEVVDLVKAQLGSPQVVGNMDRVVT